MDDENMTREELIAELKAMRLQSTAPEKKALPGNRRWEDEMRRLAHKLTERVKELDCLYGISSLIETPDISMEGILQGTVELLPSAWQHPHLVCARIVRQDQIFETANFQESAWRVARDIKVRGERTGRVEVCYRQEPPPEGQEPFLPEEVKLLDAVAARLGRVIERKLVEEERERLITELQNALSEVKKLSGLLPICASCKKIRDDKGDWEQMEVYIRERSEADFSHGICPDCAKKLYPEFYKSKHEDDPS